MAVDPDTRARTHMANERTFLAWFRTGLAVIALGIAAAQFLGIDSADGRLVQILAITSILTGGFIVGVGGIRYWTRQGPDRGGDVPARPGIDRRDDDRRDRDGGRSPSPSSCCIGRT